MKNLKTLRLSKKLKSAAAGIAFRILTATIYNIENQITEPDIATFNQISGLF